MYPGNVLKCQFARPLQGDNADIGPFGLAQFRRQRQRHFPELIRPRLGQNHLAHIFRRDAKTAQDRI